MKKIFILLSLLIISNPLFADVSTNNQAQQIIDTFNMAAKNWTLVIIPAAMWIFWSLVTIDWVFSFGFMAIKGTDFAELFFELIRKVIIIGFFLILFTMIDMLDKIPQSLGQLANNASGVDIEPDTILEQGFLIVNAVWNAIGWSFDSIGLFFAGVIILIAFALMAAQLFITIVKLYLLIAGAYIVFALGGLSQTRSYAINPIISVIKAGMELFFIKLILGLSVTTIQSMAANVATDNNSIMAMIAVAILLASLVQMVPGLVESLISGHFAGNSTSGMGMAKAVGAAAVGGAVGTVAGGIAGSSAISAAKDLSAAGQGSMMGNLAKAAGTDAVNSITGANKYAAGNMGVRMANAMGSEASTLSNVNSIKRESKNSGTANYTNSKNSPPNDLQGAISSENDSNSDSSNSEYISGVNEDNFNK